MTTHLSFAEEFRYDDSLVGISIPVTLHYGEKSLRSQAKVDTGAEVCLFMQEHALALGLPLEQGLPIVLAGLGGSIEAFGHEVILQTGNIAFQTTVYFAKHPGLSRNLLGRRGWLRNLKLAVIDYDCLLYLNAYDSSPR
jgi:hypothetical protein